MAGAKFEMEGVDEMISKLDTTEGRVRRGVNRVLKRSAEPLKNQISENVNRSNVTKPGHIHAKDDTVISSIKGTHDEKHVDVGYENVGWRMHFVEFGTIYQPAQSNVQRAIADSTDEVLEIQARELRWLFIGNS